MKMKKVMKAMKAMKKKAAACGSPSDEGREMRDAGAREGDLDHEEPMKVR